MLTSSYPTTGIPSSYQEQQRRSSFTTSSSSAYETAIVPALPPSAMAGNHGNNGTIGYGYGNSNTNSNNNNTRNSHQAMVGATRTTGSSTAIGTATIGGGFGGPRRQSIGSDAGGYSYPRGQAQLQPQLQAQVQSNAYPQAQEQAFAYPQAQAISQPHQQSSSSYPANHAYSYPANGNENENENGNSGAVPQDNTKGLQQQVDGKKKKKRSWKMPFSSQKDTASADKPEDETRQEVDSNYNNNAATQPPFGAKASNAIVVHQKNDNNDNNDTTSTNNNNNTATNNVAKMPQGVHPRKIEMKNDRKAKMAGCATTGAIVGAILTGPGKNDCADNNAKEQPRRDN